MYRVLHIMAGADAGGISTVVLNYYRFIDRTVFHFDIAVTTDMIGQNAKQLVELGAEIHRLPLKSNGIFAYEQALTTLLGEHHYDAIHVHENETSYIALKIAKKMGVKCRIAHSHTSSPYVSFKGELKRLSGCVLNYRYATNVIACGRLAGERVFGKINMRRKKASVLPNAIDTARFQYDENIRNVTREALGVEDRYVVGMVGRLSPEKNHLFALNFFRHVSTVISNAQLILVGNGPDEDKIRGYVEKNDMSSCVMLLGRRDDVDHLYQAFDVLIMPSYYEGFPVVAVEGIATGLPVLLSNKITSELTFCESVKYLPLRKKLWANALLKTNINLTRESKIDELKNNNLDVTKTVKILEKIYLDE